ncbi:transcriptional regulator, MarR [Nocardia nova SH22a]|uniref:Transcriptional regulator, MarR n=1 Tax=Nocardia nova SH22a TaxID=1415166 RepID=W5TDW4_9NOCA|nr:helix-turn-helix domain-containing GNAT family N-acetyltransferase [Nocardia nova]AHH17203.1 transcriptional regulator, MarR [Nocardia nova SH22a]
MTTAIDTPGSEQIAAVRAFNRRYTRLIGVLEEHLLDSDFTLTEARILFELAHSGPMPVRDLRTGLGLDPGYLSRLLARFDTAGLVTRLRSDADGRCQRAELTAAGRAAAADLDRRSSRGIAELLAARGDDERARIVAAMRTIEHLLDPAPTEHELRIRAPEPGDYGWIVARNGAIYAAEYGWNVEYEALVARIVADFLATHDPESERAWIAESGGVAVGAVFCVRENATTARLRLLLVEPSARGLGVGTALVGQCLRFAAEAGYRDIVLWTNDVLASARRVYERAGFELVESQPHHSFGGDLVGQTWRRELG